MKAKIDLYKFVCSLMERYYEKIHIDPATTKCWLDNVLEDQGLEYKDGEIVEITQESSDDRIRKEIIQYIKDTNKSGYLYDEEWIAWLEKREDKPTIRERYKNIGKSEWFKRTYEGISVSDDEESKRIDKDDRIRKVIRGLIYTRPNSFFDNGISKEEMLAWLDKQAEQKPIDKVQPKFKVGDWVVISTSDGRKIVQVVSIEYFPSGKPRYITDEGKWFGNGTKAYPWTIADAKDGDILANDNSIFIFQEEYIAEKPIAYCGLMNGLFIEGKGACWTNKNCYPATKEQCDALFVKMKDAGYEFDFDKKELKKIEEESKQSEDEQIRKSLIEHLQCDVDDMAKSDCAFNFEAEIEELSKYITWLEKQGNKPKKVSIWKHWKDGIAGGAEGEQIFLTKIGRIYSISSCLGCECDYIELSELDKLMREEKPKWTEEDSLMVDSIIDTIKWLEGKGATNMKINWLKSIKKRMEE